MVVYSELVSGNEFRVDGYEIKARRNGALEIVDAIVEQAGNIIPQDSVDLTKSRIDKAFFEYETGISSEGQATSAFLIHPRDLVGGHPELKDIRRHLPALNTNYGVDDLMVENLHDLLPPLEVGRIRGILPNGTPLECAIITAPITPTQLYTQKSAAARFHYARPRIQETVTLAKRFGAKTIGLGETLAALTKYGEILQSQTQFADLNIVTGHAMTTYYILEWVKYAIRQMHYGIHKVPITVIGADGSIGRAVIDSLVEMGAKRLTLHDVEGKENSLLEAKKDLEDAYLGLTCDVKVGDEGLIAACKGRRVIVSAAAVAQPILNTNDLHPKTIIIDDSQPPTTIGQSIWPVGKLPLGITRTFDYGLIGGAEWGCALEVILKEMAGDQFNLPTVGPVNYGRVKRISELARQYGIGLPPPQSFGKLYSSSKILDNVA